MPRTTPIAPPIKSPLRDVSQVSAAIPLLIAPALPLLLLLSRYAVQYAEISSRFINKTIQVATVATKVKIATVQ